MESQESRKLAVTLERLAAEGADSVQITVAIVSTWKSVDAALAPVIGSRGVAALYGRSLYLIRASHPLLGAIQQDVELGMDLSQLESALAGQASAAAAAAGGAHLQSLYELLGSLVGASLTGQLLRSAWDNTFDGLAAEEIRHDR